MNTATRGRFAPTPSGPLHFGSLVTALGSWLDAKQHNGDWFLRIDDLDAPRVRPGAIDSILSTLDAFGLEWTGPVLYQSTQTEHYEAALARLLATGLCYRCACTRKDIADSARPGPDGPVYPGTCRRANHPGDSRTAWRINTVGVVAQFDDRLLGSIMRHLDDEYGDFVVQRSDGVHAYHLASVVDDAFLGITDALRGADLVPSTLRQVFLCRALGIAPPRFAHLPVLIDTSGKKLSKSAGNLGVDAFDRARTMFDALAVLGQNPPAALREAPVREMRDWALAHWNSQSIPIGPILAAPDYRSSLP